jgi:hypothetical protein
MDDEEINALLNGHEMIPGGNLVQANWNIGGGGGRETTYIPTCERGGVTGFEDDYDDPKYQVQHHHQHMKTIKEDALEESKYSQGSDTAYFNNDYDSQEEADFNKR